MELKVVRLIRPISITIPRKKLCTSINRIDVKVNLCPKVFTIITYCISSSCTATITICFSVPKMVGRLPDKGLLIFFNDYGGSRQEFICFAWRVISIIKLITLMIMRMRKLNEIFPTDNFRATRRAWEFNKVAVMQMLIEKTTGRRDSRFGIDEIFENVMLMWKTTLVVAIERIRAISFKFSVPIIWLSRPQTLSRSISGNDAITLTPLL